MKASLVFFLLALAASVTHGYRFRSDGCPEPYDRFDDTRCILVDPYVARTYVDAMAFCKGHGGNLLHYDNCHDQNLLNDYLHQENSVLTKHYWLAATDEAKQGEFIWEHNKKPVPNGNPFWHIGNPTTSTVDDCVYLDHRYSHRWIDTNCISTYMAICLRNN